MHADYLSIKESYLEHAVNNYRSNTTKKLTMGSRAGMPSSVPSYYGKPGSSNVSIDTVSSQAKEHAIEQFKQQVTDLTSKINSAKKEEERRKTELDMSKANYERARAKYTADFNKYNEAVRDRKTLEKQQENALSTLAKARGNSGPKPRVGTSVNGKDPYKENTFIRSM